MKKRLLTAALAACLSLAPACAPNAAGGGSTANGSIGVSRDDSLLFAADQDLDTVFIVDTRSQAVTSQVKVGRQPEKLLVGPDDTVFVTNRLDRSVSIIRKGETTATSLSVGVEPVGLALTTDGRTLYVVNATSLTDSDFGTLMAFDTNTLKMKWEAPVGHEPRAITLMGDGKAAISLYKQGDLVIVDLNNNGKLIKSGTKVYEALNANALGLTSTIGGTARDVPIGGGAVPFDPNFPTGTGPRTARPMGLEAMTVSPDGQQLYVASLIATDTVLNTTPGGAIREPIPGGGSAGYGGGSCGTTAVASPALLTFDAEGNAQVDDLTTCQGLDTNLRPPMLLTSPIPDMPVQGGKAIALEATGRFLFIANYESNNVAVVPTSTTKQSTSFGESADFAPNGGFKLASGTVSQLVSVGAGPTGIAVQHDGKTAWVFNSFDHSVSKLESVAGRIANAGTVKLTSEEKLDAAAVAGRKLFFSAADPRMNNPATGISCGTCHLEGREDGHVWNFPDGPRQTPSLQGRMLAKTAPFHWNGEFNDLLAFMTHTVTNRMGGSGVSPAMEIQVAAFIESMPAADNPHKDTAPDLIARGKDAFNKAECGTCHNGEAFTDNTFADVGTFVKTGAVVDNLSFLPKGGLNTPSLLGLARSAPYLHDGSATTLKARIMNGKALDQHGKTSRLSDTEVDDLVAYLKAL
ncbi:MAG: c-type cytochrome [Archangium sp.]|nr:c-type cytochrome [Archangium sp.]